MGWMAPGRHLSAKMVSSMITNEGAIRERYYDDWVAHRQCEAINVLPLPERYKRVDENRLFFGYSRMISRLSPFARRFFSTVEVPC
jgi:hypothetical protein